jgi:hypothetical protein
MFIHISEKNAIDIFKVALRLEGDFIIDSKIGKALSREIVMERQKVPYTSNSITETQFL